MKRCIGCMEMHEDELQECPYCGYSDDKIIEPHYLKPGTELFSGRYKIGNVLGRGGFGITYIAWDNIAEKKVSIKEYFPNEFSSRSENSTVLSVFSGIEEENFNKGLISFTDEAKRLAKLSLIDGIIKIFDCFEENNTAYIVMEYLEGESLEKKLEREKKMSVDDALNMMMPIMKSLVMVHNEGIIHRDISPDNIYVLKDGTAKLLDFGASRQAFLEQTRSLTVIVKAGYSPEEQYTSNGNQGTWTDVYAVAATLYRMITGNKPIDAISRTTSLHISKKDTLASIEECKVDADKHIIRAIEKAMNVHINERTQDVQTFIDELQNPNIVKGIKIRKILKEKSKIIGISLSLFVIAIFVVTCIIDVYPGKCISNIVKIISNDSKNSKKDNNKEKQDINDNDINEETENPEENVYVMQVVGLSEEEGIRILKEQGLEVECVYVTNSELSEGVIIAQNPEAEANVSKNTVISLQICQNTATGNDGDKSKTNSNKKANSKKDNSNNDKNINVNNGNNEDNNVDTSIVAGETGNSGSNQNVTQSVESAQCDYKYTVSGKNIIINKYLGATTSTSVTIPSTIEGKTVKALGDGAFSNFYELKEIYIPGTVNVINNNAFYDCHSLEVIKFGGSESEWKNMSCNALYNNKVVVTAHKNVSVVFNNILDKSYKKLETNTFGYGYCICYGKDYYVSGTSSGIYYMNKNNTSWSTALTTSKGGFLGVCYAKGLFVAVGFEGIYTSNDAKKWTKICDSDTLWTINYGNGKYVAIGEGTSYYSTDGTNWTKNIITTSKSKIKGSTYGNGRFVAAGENGESYYSMDGVSWSKMLGISSRHHIHDITYGKGRYIAVGNEGASYYSTDGITWIESGGLIKSLDYCGVTFVNNQFIAFGWERNSPTSLDGTNWNSPTPTSVETTEDVTYRDGVPIFRATVIFEK